LRTLHSVCFQLFTATKDLSALGPLFDVFGRINTGIAAVLQPNNNGKFVTLLILLEGSLFESLLKHFTSTNSGTEPLCALTQQLAPPEFLGIIRKILTEECFRSCHSAEPMAVDDSDKGKSAASSSAAEDSHSLASILNPKKVDANKESLMFSYEPLLSSEYQAQHQDIFEDYNEVVTVALLRLSFLTLTITKPDGMYDSCKDLILVGLSASTSRYLRKEVKEFAKFVCADDVKYHVVRDGNMLETETKWLESAAACSENFTAPMSSSEVSRAIDHLSVLTKLSNKRANVWKAFCDAHPEVYKLLHKILSSITDSSFETVPTEIVTALMSLLCHSLTPFSKESSRKSSDEEKSKEGDAKEATPVEKEFIAFLESDAKKLNYFANVYCLQFTDSAVRKPASEFLKRCWYHTSEPEGKRVLKELFTQMVQTAPTFGAQSAQFMKALGCMFQESKPASEMEESAVAETEVLAVDPKVLVSMLRSQNRILQEHQNASLYKRLRDLKQDTSKCLFEARPCLRCNAASTEFKDVDLSSLSNQMRATSMARYYRLKNSCMINSLHLSIQKRRSSSRTVKVLNIYVNTRKVSDVIDLRDKWDLWKRVQSVRLSADANETVVSFARPLSAANICLEVAELHERSRKEPLKCPRCSNSVPDRHGVCTRCGENAYQCRNCRYIPYENYDAFFCPQCGSCQDCQFEVTMSVCQSFVPQPVESDDDLKKATETLEAQASDATQALLNLSSLKTEASLLLYP